jgi:hypothetical protein
MIFVLVAIDGVVEAGDAAVQGIGPQWRLRVDPGPTAREPSVRL